MLCARVCLLTCYLSLALASASSVVVAELAVAAMPKIRTSKTKYPEGWELIEPTLRELEQKMREGTVLL